MLLISRFIHLFIVAFIMGVAYAETPSQRLIVGLDVSGTSPLFHEATQKQALQKIKDEITALKYKDTIHIRSFGEYHGQRHAYSQDITLNRYHKPRVVIPQITQHIQTLINAFQTGQTPPHNRSNIVAFLDRITQQYPCSERLTHILLLSDGMEHSSLASTYDEKPDHLPFMQDRLVGCEIHFIGFGQEKSITSHQHYRALTQWWEEFARLSQATIHFH